MSHEMFFESQKMLVKQLAAAKKSFARKETREKQAEKWANPPASRKRNLDQRIYIQSE